MKKIQSIYETGMSCITCQNCKTQEVKNSDGQVVSERSHCIVDGCEVDDNMICDNYQ